MIRHIFSKNMMLCLLLLIATSRLYADTSIINQYDANGNLVSGDGRYYQYNDASQLVRVRQGDQTGSVIAEYFYDASGQRAKKIENGVVTYYVGKHFEKQLGGENEGSTSYYFGEDGERLARKDPTGSISYYHLDHLDGVNVVTDSSGTPGDRNDYLPFGDSRQGSSTTEKYTYTGKEKDKTSLYYFEARYNSPEFRHFTQADIAEPDYNDPQDLNRYAYVGNNPLSYVDYDGFKKKKKTKKKAKLSKREKWMIAHGVDPDKNKKNLKNLGLKITKELAKAPDWKIVHVKGYINSKSGKIVKSYWRRAPNTVKSGASKIGLLAGPVIQAAQDWNRNDLSGGQKMGRYSFSVLESAVPGFEEAGELIARASSLAYGTSVSYDEVKADYFSDKNPMVKGLSDFSRKVGGQRFDNWLIKQDWIDAF